MWTFFSSTCNTHVPWCRKTTFIMHCHFQEFNVKRRRTIVSVGSQKKKIPEHHRNDGAETTCLRNGKPIFQFNPSSLPVSDRGPTLKEIHVFLQAHRTFGDASGVVLKRLEANTPQREETHTSRITDTRQEPEPGFHSNVAVWDYNR